MRFLLWAALCYLLPGFTLFSQTDNSLPAKKPVAGFYLKASPLALLETDGGIGISGEYLLNRPRLGFQLEAQPIFFSTENTHGSQGSEAPIGTQRTGMPMGIKLRPEVRYYFTFDKIIKKGGPAFRFSKPKRTPVYVSTGRRNYVAIDFLYKYVVRERQGELNVFNGGTSPAYTQQFTYEDVKQVTGWDVKFGSVAPISKTGRWLLEYYLGFGFRRKTFQYRNLPMGVLSPNRAQFLNFSGGTQVTKEDGVSLPMGLKLVYKL